MMTAQLEKLRLLTDADAGIYLAMAYTAPRS